MLKTQTKKIKNRKVSKILAGILSLVMFATSNGSFLVWGMSEGQLNFLGEPTIAQAKTAEAKVIETADAITVDEIMQKSQPKSHWWEFWKKEKTENQQTASGFSDLKTELVAREVLGDKTVDALSDDLKTGKNDLTSKESKNKINFFKKLWANFEGAFNGSLTTRISILERLGGNNSNYGNDEISNMGKKIYQMKLDKSEKKQLEQEARKRAKQVVRQKARKEYEQYKESVLSDNREPVGFEQYFQENWGDDAIDYQVEEEYRTLRNDKINSRRAEKMAEYANKTLLPNIKETLKKEIESSWYLTKLVREFNGNKQEALKERNRRLEKLNQTQFDDPYKYGFRFGGARRRNMMAFYDPITDKIYINADANWMSNNATRLDQVSGKFESDMVAHEVMHAITMKMSSDKSRAELVNEDTELKVGDMVKPYSRDMNLSFEMYDYLTTPAEFIVRQKFATYDLEKYCGKKITADVTTDQINCLRKIEEESPEKLHPHTLEFLRITKPDKIKESINTIADTKQYATGNQDELYAETRPYNPKTDGDIVDPITGEKVQTAKKKEGWLAGLIGKVFGPKESAAGDGDNTELFVDGNGDVRDENGLYKGEIWEKYSKEARQEIQSDPSNTSQQSAKLKAIEEKNGWLASGWEKFKSWFGGGKNRTETTDGDIASFDSGAGDTITGLGGSDKNNSSYDDLVEKYGKDDMKGGYGDEIAGLDGSRSESNNQLNDNQQKVAFEENPREADLMNSIGEGSAEYNDPSQIQTTGGTIRGMSRNQILRELNRINNQINDIHGIKVDSNGNDSRNKMRNLLQYRKKLQESLNSGLVGENGNNGNQVPIVASTGDGYDENGNFRPTGLAGSTFNISQKEKKSWLASGLEKVKSWFGGGKNRTETTDGDIASFDSGAGDTITGLGGSDKNNSSYDDLVEKYGKDDMKGGYGDEIAGLDGSRSESNNQLNNNQQQVAFEENPHEVDLMNSIERSTEYNDPSQIQTTGGTIGGMTREQILQRLNEIERAKSNIHGIRVDSNGYDSRKVKRDLEQEERELRKKLLNSGLVGESGNNGNQMPIVASTGDGYDENGQYHLTGAIFDNSKKEKKTWLASGWEKFKSWFGGNKNRTETTDKDIASFDSGAGDTIAGLGGSDKNNSSYDDLVEKYRKDDMKGGYRDEIVGVKEQMDKNDSFVTDASGDKILGASDNQGFWNGLLREVNTTYNTVTRSPVGRVVADYIPGAKDIAQTIGTVLNVTSLANSAYEKYQNQTKNTKSIIVTAKSATEAMKKTFPVDSKITQQGSNVSIVRDSKGNPIGSIRKGVNGYKVVKFGDKNSSSGSVNQGGGKMKILSTGFKTIEDARITLEKQHPVLKNSTKRVNPDGTTVYYDKSNRAILSIKKDISGNVIIKKFNQDDKNKKGSTNNQNNLLDILGELPVVGKPLKNVSNLLKIAQKAPETMDRIQKGEFTSDDLTLGAGILGLLGVSVSTPVLLGGVLAKEGYDVWNSKSDAEKEKIARQLKSSVDDIEKLFKKSTDQVSDFVNEAGGTIKEVGDDAIAMMPSGEAGKFTYLGDGKYFYSSNPNDKKIYKRTEDGRFKEADLVGNPKELELTKAEIIKSAKEDAWGGSGPSQYFVNSSDSKLYTEVYQSEHKKFQNVNDELEKAMSQDGNLFGFNNKWTNPDTENGTKQRQNLQNNIKDLPIFGTENQLKYDSRKSGRSSDDFAYINSVKDFVGRSDISDEEILPVIVQDIHRHEGQNSPKNNGAKLELDLHPIKINPKTGREEVNFTGPYGITISVPKEAGKSIDKLRQEAVEIARQRFGYDESLPVEDLRKIFKKESEKQINKIVINIDKIAGNLGISRHLSNKEKTILADLVYNMGEETLKGFKGFRRAFNDGEYQKAALELMYSNPDKNQTKSGQSPYCKQTGNRCIENAAKVASLQGNNLDKARALAESFIEKHDSKLLPHIYPSGKKTKIDKDNQSNYRVWYNPLTWFGGKEDFDGQRAQDDRNYGDSSVDNDSVAFERPDEIENQESKNTEDFDTDKNYGDSAEDYDNVVTPREETHFKWYNPLTWFGGKEDFDGQRAGGDGNYGDGDVDIANNNGDRGRNNYTDDELKEHAIFDAHNYGTPDPTLKDNPRYIVFYNQQIGNTVNNNKGQGYDLEEGGSVWYRPTTWFHNWGGFFRENNRDNYVENNQTDGGLPKYLLNNSAGNDNNTVDGGSNEYNKGDNSQQTTDDGDVNSDMIDSFFPAGQIDSDVLESLNSNPQFNQTINSMLTADDGYSFSDFLENGVYSGVINGSREAQQQLRYSGADAGDVDVLKIIGSNIIESSTQEFVRQAFGEDLNGDGKKELNWFENGVANLAGGVLSGVAIGDTDRLAENVTGAVINMGMASMAEHGVISPDTMQALSGSSQYLSAGAQDMINGDFEQGLKTIGGGFVGDYVDSHIASSVGDIIGGDTGSLVGGVAGSTGSSMVRHLINGDLNMRTVGEEATKQVLTVGTRKVLDTIIINSDVGQDFINGSVNNYLNHVKSLPITNGSKLAMAEKNIGSVRSGAENQITSNYGGAYAGAISAVVSIGSQLFGGEGVSGERVAQDVMVGLTSYYFGPILGKYLGKMFQRQRKKKAEKDARYVQREIKSTYDLNHIQKLGLSVSEIERATNFARNGNNQQVKKVIRQSLRNSPLGKISSLDGFSIFYDAAVGITGSDLWRINQGNVQPGQIESSRDFFLDQNDTGWWDKSGDEGSKLIDQYIHHKNKLIDCYKRKDQKCLVDTMYHINSLSGDIMSWSDRKFNKEIADLNQQIFKLEQELSHLRNKEKEAELRALKNRRADLRRARDQFANTVSRCSDGLVWSGSYKACVTPEKANNAINSSKNLEGEHVCDRLFLYQIKQRHLEKYCPKTVKEWEDINDEGGDGGSD